MTGESDDLMDDAIHIAAPWEPRSSLCGQWRRINLAAFDGEIADGMAACWTCVMAERWILAAASGSSPKREEP